ncbi:MAG: hypothetical protein MJ252_26090 [archaeon]|nr:hypothetical protein [archaeon]
MDKKSQSSKTSKKSENKKKETKDKKEEKKENKKEEKKKEETKSSEVENEDLPQSKFFGLSYDDLLKTSKKYISLIENYTVMGNTGKKVMSKDDLTVVRNLLEEIQHYLEYLAVKPLLQLEFFCLYQCAVRILDLLKGFKLQKDILLIEKLTRMRFLKIEYKMHISKNDVDDAMKAEAVIDEMMGIQKEKDVSKHMTNTNIADLVLLKAQCKLNKGEVFEALELGNKGINFLNDVSDENESERQTDKRFSKMTQILWFLAEIYDLLKE